MRLGINGWRIQGNRTGVGRYLHNVVAHWTPELVDGLFDEIRFYSPIPIDDLRLPAGIEVRHLGPNWKMLIWENTRLALAADEDVVFCPSYSRPLWIRGKTVVATHDVTHALFARAFPWKVRMFYDPLYRWSARNAALVITSTEASRRDIVRVWNVSPDRIRVVPLAIADSFRPLDDAATLAEVAARYFGDPAAFFLSVGQSGRRDLPRLLEAFGDFKRRTGAPHKLLLVGIRSDAPGLDEAIRGLDLASEVRQTGYVSDAELNAIYNAAIALVMPSVYETISLPVIEAQAVGTPVITIDTEGARENSGGHALFVPALETRHLSDALERLAADPVLRTQLAAGGRRHAADFSWARCARGTLEVLAEAASL